MLPSLNESPLPVTYAAVLFFIPKAVLWNWWLVTWQKPIRNEAFRRTHVRPALKQDNIPLQLHVDVLLLFQDADGVITKCFHSSVVPLSPNLEIFGYGPSFPLMTHTSMCCRRNKEFQEQLVARGGFIHTNLEYRVASVPCMNKQ